MNRRIVLASRPTGEPTAENFRLEAGAPIPEPASEQMLVKTSRRVSRRRRRRSSESCAVRTSARRSFASRT